MSASVFGKITVLKRNGSSGSQYPVTKNYCTFGRDAECEIRIQLPTVSDRECELRTDENGNFVLSKINQGGEILVNNSLVDTDATISHNDVLTIAGRSFRFEYPPTLMNVENMTEAQIKAIGIPKLDVLQRLRQSQSRRVSFGPQLSPEQFAAFMPPNTPVKKGAIPMDGIVETPQEISRRRSVLKEKPGAKSAKRKSVEKKPSPKIINNVEDPSKSEKQCSFDELVAMVGLDNVPKSGKSTPARKHTVSKLPADHQTPVTSSSGKKNKRRSSILDPSLTTEHSDAEKTPTMKSTDLGDQFERPEMFENATPTPKSQKNTPARRKSTGKPETPKTSKSGPETVIEDSTLPIVVNKVESAKKRRISAKMVAATDMDDTVPYESSPVAQPAKKRRNSAKVATPKPQSPPTHVVIMDDTLPYVVEKGTTPGGKARRSSAKIVTPSVRSSEVDVGVEMANDTLLNEVVVEKSTTPGGKARRSSAKIVTPSVQSPENNVKIEAAENTLPYEIGTEQSATSVKKSRRISAKVETPKALVIETAQIVSNVLDDTVPFIDTIVEKATTPAGKRKSLKSATPKIAAVEIFMDDTLPCAEEPSVDQDEVSEKKNVGSRTPITTVQVGSTKKRKSIGKTPKSVDSTPKSISCEPEKIDQKSDEIEDTLSTVAFTKTPKSSTKKTRRISEEKSVKSAGKTPKSSKKSPNNTSEEIVPNLDTSYDQLNIIEKKKTPARKSISKTPQLKALDSPYIELKILEKEWTPVGKGVTPKPSSQNTPGVNSGTHVPKTPQLKIIEKKPTQTQSSIGKGMTPSTRKTPARRVDTPRPTPKREVLDGVVLAKSTTKAGAKTPVIDDSNIIEKNLDMSYQEFCISEKKATPARKSTGKVMTPKLSTEKATPTSSAQESLDVSYEELHINKTTLNRKSVSKTPKSPTKSNRRSAFMIYAEDQHRVDATDVVANEVIVKTESKEVTEESKSGVAPGRRSMARKTPRRSVGSQLVSRKSIIKSSKRKSLRIKSGVLLWSEIVRKNTDKQLETKPTTLLMNKQPTKHGLSKIAKTPQQLKAMRHADSPATIYIGRKKKKTSDDSTPVDFDMSANYSNDESYADDSILSVSEKSIAEETVATKTPLRRKNIVDSHLGTKRMFKTPKDKVKGQSVEEHLGTKRLLKTPKEKVKVTEIQGEFGTKRLLKTPKVKSQEVKEHFGTKRLLQTPKEKIKNESVKEHFGTKRLMQTPTVHVKNAPVEKNFGTKRLMQTPTVHVKNSPVEKNFGTKRLLTTPKEKKKNQPIENHFGMKRLMQTPKEWVKGQPVEDHFGTKRLFQTQRQKVITKPIEGDYCLDGLFPTMEEAEVAPKESKVDTESEVMSRDAPVSDIDVLKPIKRSARGKKQPAKTTKAKKTVVEESVVGSIAENDAAPVKRSSRKRKTPAPLDENMITMADKKVRYDEKEAENITSVEGPPKRSSRARKGKVVKEIDSVPDKQEKNIGKTEITTVIEEKNVETTNAQVVEKPPKKTTRGRSTRKTPDTKQAVPTKRSARGRGKVEEQQLEAIAEQDETQNMKVAENQPESTPVSNVSATAEVPKVISRSSTCRGKVVAVVEEVAPVLTTQVYVVVTPVGDAPPAPRQSRTKRTAKVTKTEDESAVVAEPPKKQSRSKKTPKNTTTESENASESKTTAIVAKRPSRSRKSSKDEENTPAETKVSSTRSTRGKKNTEPKQSRALDENVSGGEATIDATVVEPVTKPTRKRKTPESTEAEMQNAPKRRNVVEENVVENVPKRSTRAKKAPAKVAELAPIKTKSAVVKKSEEPAPVRKTTRTTRRVARS